MTKEEFIAKFRSIRDSVFVAKNMGNYEDLNAFNLEELEGYDQAAIEALGFSTPEAVYMANVCSHFNDLRVDVEAYTTSKTNLSGEVDIVADILV